MQQQACHRLCECFFPILAVFGELFLLENRRPCRPARKCSLSVRLDLLLACTAAVLDRPSRRVPAVVQHPTALFRRRADGCETARSLSENVRKHPITWSAPARYSWPSPLVRTVLRALFEAMYCLHALGPLARAERAAEGSALDADRWRRDRQGHGP